jgi:hypothetical protein
MPDESEWEWVAPTGWPTPPPGWVPPLGWQPDPAWPLAPPDHVWWRRPEKPRRRRRRRTWLIVGVATLLLAGGCTALTLVGGPCSFDPPPGDVSAVPVINDTSSSIIVGECHDDACRSLDQHLPVASHTTGHLQVEACNGGRLGIAHGTEASPSDCLREPTEDSDFRLAAVRVSDATPCRQ